MLAAAAGMGGVLAAFGTGDLSLLVLLAGAVVGTAAYAVLLVAFREISVAELAAARASVMARLPRRRSG